MESEWRYNVADYGWQLGPVGLFAPLLDVVGYAISDLSISPGTHTAFTIPLLPGDVAVPAFVLTDPVPGSHFPYGHSVSPD